MFYMRDDLMSLGGIGNRYMRNRNKNGLWWHNSPPEWSMRQDAEGVTRYVSIRRVKEDAKMSI